MHELSIRVGLAKWRYVDRRDLGRLSINGRARELSREDDDESVLSQPEA